MPETREDPEHFFFFLMFTGKIKALKALLWHLSREPMLKKKKNEQTMIYYEQAQTNQPKDEQA